MAADVTSIKENNKSAHDSLTAIHIKLDALTHLETRITDVEDRMTGMEATLLKIGQQIDDMENRSRRSNLIIYGILETENETTECLETEVINKLIRDKLKVTISGIERIHRLGKKSEDKTRPVIFKLLDFRDKIKILKNCPKLKGTKISVSEDFSIRVRNIRKQLWDSCKVNRDNREKVSLVYDKIKVNDTLYAWDAERGVKVEATKNRPSQKAE